MPRSVFWHVLRDHRRAMVWWSVGIVVFVVVELVAYPSVRQAAGVQDMWQQMPDAMKAMFGMDNNVDFLSGAGFLEAELFGFTLPLFFAILAITIGSKAVAGEEDAGMLEIQLAHPVSRTRYLLESFAASAIVVSAPAVAALVVLVIGDPIAGIDVPLGNLVAAFCRLVLFGTLFSGVAIAVGAALGRRSLTAAICGAIGLALFLASTLGRLVHAIEPVGNLSPFQWLLGNHPVATGFTTGLLVAAALTALVVGVGTAALNHRDLR